MSTAGEPASPAAAAAARLSPFQKVMLLWEDSHPYNGAHVVRLDGPADAASWRRAVAEATARAGLGLLAIDRDRASYSLEPAGPIDVHVIEPGPAPAAEALWQAVHADINTPFPGGPHHPVRWSVADDPESRCHYVAAVYRHVTADAASMGAIIADAIGAHLGFGPREKSASILEVGASARVDPAARGGGLRALARATRLYFRLRRCHRMRLRKDCVEKGTNFIVLDARRGLLGRLSTAVKARGATVNDAFLAALASALSLSTPGRRSHPTRRALALGFVADLRAGRGEGTDLRRGVRVGHTVVVIDEPDEPCLEALLDRVAALTRAEKQAGSLSGTPWSFIALSRLKRWLPREGARAWYRKVYPISAGVSNVRWRAETFGSAKGRVLAYYRVAPPGPALPLALAPTTLGEDLTFGVSYHSGSFAEEAARCLAAAFIEKLEALAGTKTT